MPHVELDSGIREELIALAAKLKEDKLPAEGQMNKYVEVFRDRFGPSQLSAMDGPELLEKMHNQSNRDSLVYWLEYKNDEEFPTPRFGSIAGGSALKFTIFYRKESGNWMGRSPSNVSVEITPEEALKSARKHRDQLLAGLELLQALPTDATDSAYESLQAAMDSQAPDVSDLAWGHKYFSLLFSEKLDNYHNADLQRFHLIKLLQLPPDKRGRYVLAGWYVELARQLGLPMNQLTSILNVRHGRQHRYWRIGTSAGDNDPVLWPAMRDGNYVAVGWEKLGDLTPVFSAQEPRTELKRLLAERHPNTPSVMGKAAAEIARFMTDLHQGDVVVAANGNKILGVGKIESDSPYRYEPTDNFPHRRPITWLDQESWKMPQQEALQTTFKELRIPENLVAIERRIVGAVPKKSTPVMAARTPSLTPRMAGVAGRVQSILDRKGQVILFGPPGTGKTYWAERTARDLAAWHRFGESFAQLDASSRAVFDKEGLVRTCTFHPSYGY